MQFLHAVPGTCERDLIWKGSLCRYKWVELLALGVSVGPSMDPGPVYRCLVAPSTNHVWVLSLPGHAQLETHQRCEQWGKLQTLSWTLGPSCSVLSPFRHSVSRLAPALSPLDAVLCSGEAGPCWVSDESSRDESGSIFVSALPGHSLWTLGNLLNRSCLGYLLCRVQRVFIFIAIWNFWKLHFRGGTGHSESETAGWWTRGRDNLINSAVWKVSELFVKDSLLQHLKGIPWHLATAVWLGFLSSLKLDQHWKPHSGLLLTVTANTVSIYPAPTCH